MSSSFHLKGLDTLRAIAALTVIVGHIELFKTENNFPLQISVPSGHIGVVLFFVLSGFLITILLLKEKQKHSTINLKSFYLRRILRVWPLYYLVILISYLVSDFSPSATSLALCLSIFPNIAHVIGAGWVSSPQIWSIGVEEQFYAAWPFAVKNGKRLLIKLIVAFIFLSLLPHVTLFVLVRTYPNVDLLNLIYGISAVTTFQCMAVGGIVGVLYENQEFRSKFQMNRWIAWVIMAFPFILWIARFKSDRFSDEIYAILFGITILIMTTVNQKFVKDTLILKYLGKVSYGLYMYHWIVLLLIFNHDIIPAYHPLVQNVILYLIAIGGTLVIASISFFNIESWFLNLKEKFSRI
jgi:peptidoglycan/LPS O-acetylase OafA/YrhL